MASLIENLISVLEQESVEYETLLGLSMKKTPIIVKGDLRFLLPSINTNSKVFAPRTVTSYNISCVSSGTKMFSSG